MGDPEEEKETRLMAPNSSNLMKPIKQLKEFPSRINPKQSTWTHIVIKLLKVKDQKSIFKTTRLIDDFTSETRSHKTGQHI